MLRLSAPRRLTLLVILGLLALTLPAVALGWGYRPQFLATFDDAGDLGKTPTADLGQIVVSAAPGIITAQPDPLSVGQAVIVLPGPQATDVSMRCVLKKVTTATVVRVSGSLLAQEADADMVLRVDDANDSGIIDVGYSGASGFTVAGVPVGPTLAPGVEYHIELLLEDQTFVLDQWLLHVSWAGGSFDASGLLLLLAPLQVGSLDVVVPAGETGTYILDDIVVDAAGSSKFLN